MTLIEAKSNLITAYLSMIGKRGGSANTEAQNAARRLNGTKPCKPGLRRGHPFTKNQPKQ